MARNGPFPQILSLLVCNVSSSNLSSNLSCLGRDWVGYAPSHVWSMEASVYMYTEPWRWYMIDSLLLGYQSILNGHMLISDILKVSRGKKDAFLEREIPSSPSLTLPILAIVVGTFGIYDTWTK